MPEFTASQREATEYRRLDACVVAGPGSGKTTVLVERYRSLVQDHGLNTEEILAITFTEKAAANMKAKLAQQFESHPDLRRELESAWVSTIHGFCSRLLKQNAVAAGVDPRFVVLDERQSDKLQRECLHSAVNHLAETRREDTLSLIEALHSPELTGPLQDVYDAMRSAGLSVEELRTKPSPGSTVTVEDVYQAAEAMLSCWSANPTPPQRLHYRELVEWQSNAPADTPGARTLVAIWQWAEDCPARLPPCPREHKDSLKQMREVLLPKLVATAADQAYARFRNMIFDVLARFDTLYRSRKAEAGALDFNDLERQAIHLLERSPSVRERLNGQFRQIMLDEFQDINDQQWQLLTLLRGPEAFFAVGDINQSIYGFRHARPEIFENYQERTVGKHYTQLFENFRSRQQVLSCVEALLHEKDGIQPRGLTAARTFEPKSGPSVEILKAIAPERPEASGIEARSIAHRLLSMRLSPQSVLAGDRALNFKDFAVLVRTGDAMRPVLQAFDDAGIPYVSSRQDSFLLSREGLDITALLHVIVNPRDEVRLLTVLRSPLAGISDDALLRMRLSAYSLSDSLRGLPPDSLRSDDASKLARFTQNLRRWRQEQLVLPLDRLLVRVLADCGFSWTPETNKGRDVESYLHLARATGVNVSLPEFLAEVESLSDAIDKEAELSDDDQGDRVQVLTAHAAKGLEFPVVFVAAMEKEGRHGTGAVNFTPHNGLGVRWRSPDGSVSGIKDSWHVSNGDAVKKREKEESNRLLYVAMTRAEQHLVLSYASNGRSSTEWARILEEHYKLKEQTPSEEADLRQDRAPDGRMFDVSILVAARPPATSLESSKAFEGERDVLTLPRPVVEGQSDSVVTVTALAVFGQCPRKYYLQRFAGVSGGRFLSWDPEAAPEVVDEESGGEKGTLSAAELGTATHNLLAGIPGDYPGEVHDLANVFTRGALGRRAESALHVQREWEFIAALDDILVRGVVDLWFTESNGESIIVDYKTDNVKLADVPERARVYAPQLALYAMALRKAPVRAYLHFLKPNAPEEIALDEDAYEAARILARNLARAQETLQFPLNEADHCERCPYWKGRPCPAGLTRAVDSVAVRPSLESGLVSILSPG